MALSQAKCSFLQSPSRSKYEERLFLIAFSCYVFATWFSSTGYQSFLGLDYNWFRRILYGISLLCLAGKYILQGNSLKEHLLVATVGTAFLISAFVSGSHLLIWCYAFVACARHTSIKPISFCIFLVLIIVGAITFTGYFLGAIPSYDLASTATRGTRYSLGFSHPNTLAFYLLTFQLAWISMRREFLGLRDLTFLIVFALSAHFLTFSRTADGAFTLLIVCVISLLIRTYHSTSKNHGRDSIPQPLLIAIFAAIFAIVAFSIFSMLFYDGSNPVWLKLDSISSGRLHLAHQYFNESGITAFGQSFEDSAVQNTDIHSDDITFLVDNLYCNVLLRYGLVSWILSFSGVIVALNHLKRNGQYAWLLGISMFLLVGLFEALFFKPSFNYFVLGLHMSLYKDDISNSAWDNSSLSNVHLYMKLCTPSTNH